MKSQLEAFIQTHVNHPTEAEIQEILAIFEARSYEKGQEFKAAYTVATEVAFITSGSAKTLLVKDNGEERSGRLVTANHFLFDLISVRSGEPTPIAMRFLEASTVLVAPYPAVRKLLDTNLTFNILIREYTADRTVELGKWLMLFVTGSAKDRYQFILENNPKLLDKIPLRFIASMIGITPTQLSRIRKQSE